MKTINVRGLQQRIRQTLETAQAERVVITRHGEPIAVVVGIEGYDWEDVFWATDKSFWKTVQRRRQQPTTSLAEVRESLDAH